MEEEFLRLETDVASSSDGKAIAYVSKSPQQLKKYFQLLNKKY